AAACDGAQVWSRRGRDAFRRSVSASTVELAMKFAARVVGKPRVVPPGEGGAAATDGVLRARAGAAARHPEPGRSAPPRSLQPGRNGVTDYRSPAVDFGGGAG